MPVGCQRSSRTQTDGAYFCFGGPPFGDYSQRPLSQELTFHSSAQIPEPLALALPGLGPVGVRWRQPRRDPQAISGGAG